MLRSRIADMVRRITDIKKNPKVAAISWREIAYRHIGVIGALPPADNFKVPLLSKYHIFGNSGPATRCVAHSSNAEPGTRATS